MKPALHEVQDFIRTGAKHSSHDSFMRRLGNALAERGRRTTPLDLAVLLRQATLRAHVQGEPRELFVPIGPGWPTETDWHRLSCETTFMRAGLLRVTPRAWSPQWLDPSADQVVTAALEEDRRRESRRVPADPALVQQLGWTEYSTAGQRAAVRAAFLTAPGSTTIINLPTGVGKSLCFQLPALTWRSQGALTLVIVPTVALARDQEARFRALANKAKLDLNPTVPLAYHGGLDDTSRRSLVVAINNGEVPVVFASPEVVMGRLRGPLFTAAKQSRLRLFVVDEAHLVGQWGDQFRPEFQALGGLRDALLAACPPAARFRTLLLSATLTAESIETLRTVFGREDCELVSELALRNEIGFLVSNAPSEGARIDRVIEALDHLPRPLILYTTRRDHAEQWYVRLRSRGYGRLRLVRGGDLSNESGVQLLEDWREGGFDVVVATSAFGLGMDQSEVRSVVHACLPETIDRFYQEVGRAGRDGNAAVSLLVSAPEDVMVARDLAEKKRIGVDRGYERWLAMWVGRRAEDDNTWVLRLDSSPPDITSSGERNEAWNLRTLVLMARARLIEFAAHQVPSVEQATDEDLLDFQARRKEAFEKYSLEVAIRLLDANHADKQHWDRVVSQVRERLREQDRLSSSLAAELMDLRRPLNDVFADAYRISDPPVRPPRVLGSCPISRARGMVSFTSTEPELVTFENFADKPRTRLQDLLLPCTDTGQRAWVAYSPPSSDALEQRAWRAQVILLLQELVANGVVELCVAASLCASHDWHRLLSQSRSQFLIRSELSEESERILCARITVLDPHCDSGSIERAMRVARPLHIILLPVNSYDPLRPNQRFLDRVPFLTIADVNMRLSS